MKGPRRAVFNSIKLIRYLILLAAVGWMIALYLLTSEAASAPINHDPFYQLEGVYAVTVPTRPKPLPVPPKPVINIITSKPPLCACVNFVKWLVGRTNETWGNAWDIKVDIGLDPQAGDLILTHEGRGHAAYIIKRIGDNITIDEANYISCQRSQRILSITDSRIRGFKKL